MIRKIDLESQKRMDALYEKMKKTVEDTNNSLVAISKLEETLQTYTRDLGVILSGKIAFKITPQLPFLFPDVLFLIFFILR